MRLLVNRMKQKSRLNEVALEQQKKLLNDREEMSKKMGAVLDDTFAKLMARDRDVDKEFAQMEKRLNHHRVALDKAEDRIQALEDAMAIQQAKMDSMLDNICHCRARFVRSHSSSLV